MWDKTFVLGFVLCLLFVSTAGSANLAFKKVPLSSEILSVGDNVGRVNYYTNAFDLPNLASNTPAILMLMAYDVDDSYNFITINLPQNQRTIIDHAHYRDAKTSQWFADKLLDSGDVWATQIVPIRAGLLKPTGNVIGIHTRSDSGSSSGNTDDIQVTRVYLIYYTT